MQAIVWPFLKWAVWWVIPKIADLFVGFLLAAIAAVNEAATAFPIPDSSELTAATQRQRRSHAIQLVVNQYGKYTAWFARMAIELVLMLQVFGLGAQELKKLDDLVEMVATDPRSGEEKRAFVLTTFRQNFSHVPEKVVRFAIQILAARWASRGELTA